MVSVLELREKLSRMWPHLNERARRMVAASEAADIGYGGVTLISQACGLSRVTITKGIRELEESPLPAHRTRGPGGGRRRLEANDPGLVELLESLVEPLSEAIRSPRCAGPARARGPWRANWSIGKHPISHEKVAQYLRELGYSLQGNRKTEEEGEDHPDRDAQFRHINREVRQAMAQGWPVISVDTKKKELVGNFENKGRQWRRKGTAEQVKDHDFPDPSVPRAYPYGIYDLARNTGFVNVGTDHDTATFAVASIRGWWRHEGRRLYPSGDATCSSRPMAAAATAIGCGFGRWSCSDWPIRRAFDSRCAIFHREPASGTKWSTAFLVHYFQLAGRTPAGLRNRGQSDCRHDHRQGSDGHLSLGPAQLFAGAKVTEEEMATINIKPSRFHGEWNYVIRPRTESCKCYLFTRPNGRVVCVPGRMSP